MRSSIALCAVGAVAAALVAAATFGLSACGGSSPTSPSMTREPSCTGAVTSALSCNLAILDYDVTDLSLPCPSRADVKEVQRDIPVTIKSDTSAGTLVCRERDGSVDLTRNQERIYQALLFLRRLRFDAPLPWTTKAAYDWLRSAIPKGIVIDGTGYSRSCVKCEGPITIAMEGSWVGDIPYSVIVHEARHAEGWSHTCRYTAANGFTADQTIAEMGASGVQYYLFRWIADHSNESFRLKAHGAAAAEGMREKGTFCCECATQAVASSR